MPSRLSRPALAARVTTLDEVLSRLQEQATLSGKPFAIATSAVASQLALCQAELQDFDRRADEAAFSDAVRSAAYADLLPRDGAA